jgi:tRNA dimethylallyltransferase
MNSIDDSGVADLPVLCGPTAAGKSAIAMALAERAGVAIISADSRQVYRGFDIGTAKPTAAEQAAVPHYGIDVADPDDRYTAAHWAADALRWADAIRASGRTPLIVGGTGFYLRALFQPLFVEPGMDASRRAALREYLTTLAADDVRRWCAALDLPRVAFGRAQWERAIEVALLTGRRISALHGENSRAAAVTARYLVVDPGPALSRRIADRVDAMLAAGWLDEARSLADRVPPSARAWSATGYEALRRVARGEQNLEAAREEVIVRTRQYAKRQRTWFRHQLAGERVTRIDPRAPDALERALAWLHSGDRVP